MTSRLSTVIYPVSDLAQAKALYRGLTIPRVTSRFGQSGAVPGSRSAPPRLGLGSPRQWLLTCLERGGVAKLASRS